MEVEDRPFADENGAPGPGSIFAPRVLGRYRIIAELARGSTSIVYLAVLGGLKGFNKFVAIKHLRASLAQDRSCVAMFLAEARLGARLGHANVVSTLEIEEDEDRPYIVMEYLDGQPLQQAVLAARLACAPLPLHMHLGVISGALEGLGYAHAARGFDGKPLNVVHRDVSPHNVFVTFDGMPKLLDFGVAQATDWEAAMPTSAGHIGYMSPEQAAAELVDCRSDLFAIGVMLWEAVTRRRFWPETMNKVQITESLASRRLPASRVDALGGADLDLRSLIVRATSPERDDRFPNAAELQADLRIVLQRITPPNIGARDLGLRLSTLFASERARLQKVIDSELESLSAGATGGAGDRPARSVRRPGATGKSPLPPPVAPEAVASTGEGAPSARTPSMQPPPAFALPASVKKVEGWFSRSPIVAFAAIALALVAGASISMLFARSSEPAAPIVPAQAAAAVRAPAEPASTGTTVASGTTEPPAESALTAVGAPPTPMARSMEHREEVAATPKPSKPSVPPVGRRAVVDIPRAAVSREESPADARRGTSPSEAVRVSDNHAAPARPIDSNNPYGP